MNKGIVTENLVVFFGNLREGGLLIGPSETADAIAFISAAGLSDRPTVRTGLRAMLAKSRKEQAVFDAAFDTFFVGAETMETRQREILDKASRRQERIETGRDALERYEVSEELAEAFASATEERKEWLKNMLDYAQDGNRNLPLMEAYLKKIASGWLSEEGGVGLEQPDGQDDSLLHKSFASITEEEIPQALRLVEALVRRILLASERRYRRNGRRGMPDLRQTIHRSLRTGGVPLSPAYKKRPRSSRRIVVLCDVSESMVRFSEFALTFITALSRRDGKLRAFIFSEGLAAIGTEDLTHFEKNVHESGLWRRGTDIGGALGALLAERPPAIDAQTLLLVLSDAKTVNRPLAEEMLHEVGSHTREILWLNPERQFSAFAERIATKYAAEHVTMLRCSSIEELARACASAL
ncbi:MAG: VWA domain-containing protein [Clostridiales Family XIII bacterium]|nr:VWA domain-containing protein [Clostridiales Family XIII bacterium]